jgi:hypothetical protein
MNCMDPSLPEVAQDDGVIENALDPSRLIAVQGDNVMKNVTGSFAP